MKSIVNSIWFMVRFLDFDSSCFYSKVGYGAPVVDQAELFFLGIRYGWLDSAAVVECGRV